LSVKHPTEENDLEGTLLSVLDELLARAGRADVRRIVLSTTLVTNLLATGRGERARRSSSFPAAGCPFQPTG
jgi:N-methylhydantoinase A/oxoprolinase/acetone carboxylase beta subunit